MKAAGCVNPSDTITIAITIKDQSDQIVTLGYLRERQRPLSEVACSDVMV
jgi:hypothetical protein